MEKPHQKGQDPQSYGIRFIKDQRSEKRMYPADVSKE